MPSFTKFKVLDATGTQQQLNVAALSDGSITYVFAPYQETPLGYGQLTLNGGAAAVLLSTVAGGIPSGATYCRLSVEGGGVRYRDDAAPTANLGMPMLAGTFEKEYHGNLAALQLVAMGAGATVDVYFYK